MTVTQVGKSIDSVTINVSGITKGDRQTYIYIPSVISKNQNQQWFKLSDASSYGYIDDINTNYDGNNGNIEVVLGSEYLNLGLKVVLLHIKNGINIGTTNEEIYAETPFNAVLYFRYENKRIKVPGDEIDITVSDMKELNLFGCYIDAWINGGDGRYWTLDGISSGDVIYAYYLTLPVQNILDTAIAWQDNLENYDRIYEYLSYICDNCWSDSDFEAKFFNNIMLAIVDFNLTVTV